MALTGPPSRRMGGDKPRPSAARFRAGLVLFLLLLAGCRSESRPPAVVPPPSISATTGPVSTTPTTSAPTVTDPAAEIVARYQQFWEVRFEANRDPMNPADPRLAQLATGRQLDNVVTEIRQRQVEGLAVRRPDPSASRNRVKVVEITGDSARLQDCATNDGIVYRVATGQVLDDGVVTRNVEATMRRVDGIWRLADTRVLQEWKGATGCALSPGFS